MNEKALIRRLPTGVRGLDALLGGGLAEFSFNIIAGAPGSGKTTLAHQIMFALATRQRRALFFTVLGEPAIKMLRYQQQYNFFDSDKLNHSIKYINLGDEVLKGDFDKVLARIVDEVEAFGPSLVFVDSFRSVIQAAANTCGNDVLQSFVQNLAMHLTSWQATTFLIGEYTDVHIEANPVFTIADGIFALFQSLHGNSMVRKLQIVKSRGQATLAGLHTLRIGDDGIEIFPRILHSKLSTENSAPVDVKPLSLGVPVLDQMMGGGLPAGYSLLLAGPSGSGKTLLATEFLAAGASIGENGVVASFEQSPGRRHNARLDQLIEDGHVRIVDTRALDLTLDETLYALTEMISSTGATRVVIDSLSGFELSLVPTFPDNFRESLHRMVAVLTSLGASVLMITELEDRYGELRFSPHGAAFLTDAIIVQRYVELRGELKKVMGVVKVRNRAHSHALRLYDIDESGYVIHEPTPEMEGLLTGHPRPSTTPLRPE